MTAPANPLAVIDKAAQRAIEERDQHDANGAPEYADSWESLRGELREVRATVERLAEALEQSQTALRTAATFRYTRATWARDIAAPAIAAGDAALAAFRGDG